MRNYDDRFPQPSQVRKQLGVENLPECRILVRSPLVENQNRPPFEPGSHQGQPLALTGRKIGCREAAILDRYFVSDFQPLKISFRFGRHSLCLQKIVKKIVVGENRGEELTIVVAIIRAERFAVPKHRTVLRCV